VLSSDFYCKKNVGFRVPTVHPGVVTSYYGVHEIGVTFCRVQPVLRVLFNENSTRALNTTSHKCCLPLTDAINRRKKFKLAYEGSRSPHASALHINPPDFRKNKYLLGLLSTEFQCLIHEGSLVVLILSRITPIYRDDIYSFKINSNIALPSSSSTSQMLNPCRFVFLNINTFKYRVLCTDGRFQLELIYCFTFILHRRFI
jgi:hypothetical protein